MLGEAISYTLKDGSRPAGAPSHLDFRTSTPEKFKERQLRLAAERGDVAAQIGVIIIDAMTAARAQGQAETKLAEQVERLRLAAEEGDPVAQLKVGLAYYLGEGVAADRAEAVKWLELSAGQGQAKAREALEIIAGVPGR